MRERQLTAVCAQASSRQDSPLPVGFDHAAEELPALPSFYTQLWQPWSFPSHPHLRSWHSRYGKMSLLLLRTGDAKVNSDFLSATPKNWCQKSFQATIKVRYELICHYNTAPLARHFRPGSGKGSRYLGWQFHLKDRKLSAFFSLVSWFNEHTNRPWPYAPNTSLLFFKKQLGKMPRQEAWKKLEKASRHICVAWDSKCTSD